jgi:replication factor C subunit 2/4
MTAARSRPWTDKYAPRCFDDISAQTDVVHLLKAHVSNREKVAGLPHLLFYGPPGIGKTTCIDLLIDALYGHLSPHDRQRSVLSLNASNDRGIAVVRNTITPFAKCAPVAGTPFKLIVLDECDNMTSEAQDAMRRTMETYADSTRFALMCNYLSRVAAPIASRCHKARFKAIVGDAMVQRLRCIADREQFACGEPVLREIDRVVCGDMRAALNLLQSLSVFWGDRVRPEHVAEAFADCPDSIVDELLAVCVGERSSFHAVQRACRNAVRAEGFPGAVVLRRFAQRLLLVPPSQLPELWQARALESIAQAQYCMSKAADEYLQLLAVAANLYQMTRDRRALAGAAAQQQSRQSDAPLFDISSLCVVDQ